MPDAWRCSKTLSEWLNLKTMQMMSAFYHDKLLKMSVLPCNHAFSFLFQYNYMLFPICKCFSSRDFSAIHPHFQLLTSHCPSSLSSSSVYFRFPSLLRNASTKWGFPRKKKSHKEKINPPTGKKRIYCRRSRKQSEKWN